MEFGCRVGGVGSDAVMRVGGGKRGKKRGRREEDGGDYE